MKRIVSLLSLVLLCSWAWAQNEKVVTPHTVNPSGEPASVENQFSVADDVPVTQSAGGKWYFGLGGGLDYSSVGGWYIDICPDVSYKVSNSLFVGGLLSYTYYRGESMAGVTPYARWHIVPLGKAVSVYAKAYAPVRFWTDYLYMGVRFKPGLAVRLGEGMYLMGGFGSVGYSYVRSAGVPSSGWNSNWTGDTLEIGIFFNL